jgi:hypothetical protein
MLLRVLKLYRPSKVKPLCPSGLQPHHMNYYQCSSEDLRLETQRRGYTFAGNSDQLSELLEKDDDSRGAEATTVATKAMDLHTTGELDLLYTRELGEVVVAERLVNESRS